jgi:hypothetical protein
VGCKGIQALQGIQIRGVTSVSAGDHGVGQRLHNSEQSVLPSPKLGDAFETWPVTRTLQHATTDRLAFHEREFPRQLSHHQPQPLSTTKERVRHLGPPLRTPTSSATSVSVEICAANIACTHALSAADEYRNATSTALISIGENAPTSEHFTEKV